MKLLRRLSLSTASAARRRWNRICSDARAIAAVEMALVTPVLLLLLLGTLDVGWRILADFRVQKVAATMSDLTARAKNLTEADVQDSFKAAASIASPFDIDGAGRVIVSGIRRDTGAPAEIVWQRLSPSGIEVTSKIGVEGGTADLEGIIDLQEGESAIITEVYFQFTPLVGFVLPGLSTIYEYWVARPRFGQVDELQ